MSYTAKYSVLSLKLKSTVCLKISKISDFTTRSKVLKKNYKLKKKKNYILL